MDERHRLTTPATSTQYETESKTTHNVKTKAYQDRIYHASHKYLHSSSAWLFLILLTFTSLITPSYSFINLFLNRHETYRLLGLTADLFYIREGKVNGYALKFVVPVPPHISELHFTWQSLVSEPMPYSIALSVNDVSALGTPTINI